ncbi:MAG: hypothetical protein R3Y11_06275 [Pseudomonadota bacterium]
MTIQCAQQCQGRYVLVGTFHSLLLVDLFKKEQVTINNTYCNGGYYGIASDSKYIYVGVRNNQKKRYLYEADSNGEILVYDYKFNLCHILKPDFPLDDIHEILLTDGILYITNTRYDMIAIYDGISWEKWYPLGNTKGIKKDKHHFNTLTMHNNKLYVCAHNFGPSTIHVFSLRNKEKIEEIKLGNSSHNIWFVNDEMYVCSSKHGAIISNKGFITQIAEWPRGVVLSQNSIIVGSSTISADFDSHYNNNGHIYVYDNSWKLKGYFFLQGESQIFDMYPIELLIDPSSLFEDKRFVKKSLIAISSDTKLTENEEFLLILYSMSSLRTGCFTDIMKQKYKTIYKNTLIGWLSIIKNSIKDIIQYLVCKKRI